MLALVATSLFILSARNPRGTPKSSRRASASSSPPPRIWDDNDWAYKEEQSKGKAGGGGRSRAARREKLYASLRGYADHFSPLLASEWRAEQDAIAEQIEQWSNDQLAREGWLLRQLEAQRLRKDFYGDVVLQLGLRPPREDAPRPPLPFHRFAAGDVVALCAGDEPKLPSSLSGEYADDDNDDGDDDAPIDGVVLQRTSTALQLVTRSLPGALQAGSGGRAARRVGPFCLTRGASAVPYERCQAAVQAVSDPDVMERVLCPQLRHLITSSHTGDGSVAAMDAGLLDLAADPPAFLSGSGRAAAKTVAKAAMKTANAAGTMPSSPPLGPSQTDVIRSALSRRLTLIQGPPAGKTRTACALAACVALHSGRPPPSPPPQQKQKQQPRGRGGAAADSGSGGSSSPCLAVASSNVAADELLAGLSAAGLKTLRVGQPASVRESLRNLTLDAALEGSAIVRKARDELRVQQDAKNAAGVGKAFEAVRRAEAAASRKLLMEADVVVASCVGSGRLNDIVSIPPSSPSSEPDMNSGRGGGGRCGGKGRGKGRGGASSSSSSSSKPSTAASIGSIPFRSVLIDEASQSTEPASLVPLLHGASQLFLVGDQMQLPPTVTDRTASDGGLSLSLFDRLQKCGVVPLLLDTQYRMHPNIAVHPSKAFYKGKVKSGVTAEERPLLDGISWPNPEVPIAFVSVRGEEQSRRLRETGARSEADDEEKEEEGAAAASTTATSTGTSYANPIEAAAVGTIVEALLPSLDPSSVGIITPYSAQADLLEQRRR